MPKEFDVNAEDWDSNPKVILYSKKAYASLTERIDLDNLRVMDFGCGTGLLTEKISPFVKSIFALGEGFSHESKNGIRPVLMADGRKFHA